MNRLLPSGGSRRGNCGHCEQPRLGHRWRTFGPRSFVRLRLGMLANAAVTGSGDFAAPIIASRSPKTIFVQISLAFQALPSDPCHEPRRAWPKERRL